MTLDRTAQQFADLVQQAQAVQQATAPSGGRAGTTISLRVNGRPIKARCLSAIAPGLVVAVLTATGWACLPVAATRLIDSREVEFRQRRGTTFVSLELTTKALLVTGIPPNVEYWVGGDRRIPFGPLPTVPGAAAFVAPASIMATGPGLNDWVVCYHAGATNSDDPGVSVAFADHTGIIRTRTVPFLGGESQVITSSQGLFASHRGRNRGDSIIAGEMRWTTPAENEAAPLADVLFLVPNYALPDVFLPLWRNGNLRVSAALDPQLTHAFHQRGTTPTTETLIFADGSSVALPTPIDIPVGLFSRGVSLVDLILYNTNLSRTTLGSSNALVTFPCGRWQLFEDGTFEELTPLSAGYQDREGYFPIDVSFYPPGPGTNP